MTPVAPTPLPTMLRPSEEPEQPAVAGVVRATPAPERPEPAAPAPIAARPRRQPPTAALIARLFGWFRSERGSGPTCRQRRRRRNPRPRRRAAPQQPARRVPSSAALQRIAAAPAACRASQGRRERTRMVVPRWTRDDRRGEQRAAQGQKQQGRGGSSRRAGAGPADRRTAGRGRTALARRRASECRTACRPQSRPAAPGCGSRRRLRSCREADRYQRHLLRRRSKRTPTPRQHGRRRRRRARKCVRAVAVVAAAVAVARMVPPMRRTIPRTQTSNARRMSMTKTPHREPRLAIGAGGQRRQRRRRSRARRIPQQPRSRG